MGASVASMPWPLQIIPAPDSGGPRGRGEHSATTRTGHSEAKGARPVNETSLTSGGFSVPFAEAPAYCAFRNQNAGCVKPKQALFLAALLRNPSRVQLARRSLVSGRGIMT